MVYVTSDWYHGTKTIAESRVLLGGQPPGTFLVRSAVTGQLIISFHDRGGRSMIRDIMVPNKSSVFFQENPQVQQTALDTVNYIISRCHHLVTPLMPDPDQQNEEPRLLDERTNSFNGAGLPPGYCSACEKTVSSTASRKIYHKLSDHQKVHRFAKCPKCELLFMKTSLSVHEKTCDGDNSSLNSPERAGVLWRHQPHNSYSRRGSRDNAEADGEGGQQSAPAPGNDLLAAALVAVDIDNNIAPDIDNNIAPAQQLSADEADNILRS